MRSIRQSDIVASIVGSARSAIMRRREWPRCAIHDTPLVLDAVVTRVSETAEDTAGLSCPVTECFRHQLIRFRLPDEAVKSAGMGMRFEAPPH